MTERRALLYCTFNGIANCTNGIARQTQTLLSIFERRREELFTAAGRFDLHVAIPTPDSSLWAYDPVLLKRSHDRLVRAGASLHFLNHDRTAEFWSLPVWESLSRGAVSLALQLAKDYDEVLLVAVDTPYAGVGFHLSASQEPEAERVRVLLALYGTSLLHRTHEPGRLEWERAAITSTAHPRVRIGDVGRSFTRHLVETYRLPPERLIPYVSGLDLYCEDLTPMPVRHAEHVLDAHRIPRDRPVVAAFGRTDPVKGLDLLIDALAPIAERVHLVLVAVPFHDRDPLLNQYRDQIRRVGVRATLVPHFTRELPRALCSLPLTRTIVCPSRAETLANVPFEVACWARDQGPIVTAPRLGGFVEQVWHNTTGLLYQTGSPTGLTEAIDTALTLSEYRVAHMRRAAYAEVAATRDAALHLSTTLRCFWDSTLLGALT